MPLKFFWYLSFLLTLNIDPTISHCFCCWIWIGKDLLGFDEYTWLLIIYLNSMFSYAWFGILSSLDIFNMLNAVNYFRQLSFALWP